VDQYNFSLFITHPALFIDEGLIDVIQRKTYCDKYPSVPPFPGAYDDQPDWWKQACLMIEQEISKALKHGQ